MGKPKRDDARPTFKVDPTRISRADGRTGSLRIRVSVEEAATLKQAARILGVTVSEYIRALHEQALESLTKRGK